MRLSRKFYINLENKRHGRGREIAQTPIQGLLFRQEPCGGRLQKES
jgi:hypothetical protein